MAILSSAGLGQCLTQSRRRSTDQGGPMTSAAIVSHPEKRTPTNSETSLKSTILADQPWPTLSRPKSQFQMFLESPTGSASVSPPRKRLEISVKSPAESDDSLCPVNCGEHPVLLGHSATLDAKPRSLDQCDSVSHPKKRTLIMLTSPTNSETSLKSTISADRPWSPSSSPKNQFQISLESLTDSPSVSTPRKRFEISVECASDSADSLRSDIAAGRSCAPRRQGVLRFFANEPVNVRGDSSDEPSDSVSFGKTLSLPAGGKKKAKTRFCVKTPGNKLDLDDADDEQSDSLVFSKTISLPAKKSAKTRSVEESRGGLQSDSEAEQSDSVSFDKTMSLPAGGKKKAKTRFCVKTPGSIKPDCEVMESDFMAFAHRLSLLGMPSPVRSEQKVAKTPVAGGSSALRLFGSAKQCLKDDKDISGLDDRPQGLERPARIFAKMPCGKLSAVDAELSQSVTSFKQQLRSSIAAEFGEGVFVLRYRKKRLSSNLSLKQCGVELGNVLHASRETARAPPGAGAKTFRQRAYREK